MSLGQLERRRAMCQAWWWEAGYGDVPALQSVVCGCAAFTFPAGVTVQKAFPLRELNSRELLILPLRNCLL